MFMLYILIFALLGLFFGLQWGGRRPNTVAYLTRPVLFDSFLLSEEAPKHVSPRESVVTRFLQARKERAADKELPVTPENQEVVDAVVEAVTTFSKAEKAPGSDYPVPSGRKWWITSQDKMIHWLDFPISDSDPTPLFSQMIREFNSRS